MEEKFTIQEIKEEFEKQIKVLKFTTEMAKADDKSTPTDVKNAVSNVVVDTAEMMKDMLVEGLKTKKEMDKVFNKTKKTFTKEEKDDLENCLNDLLRKLFE